MSNSYGGRIAKCPHCGSTLGLEWRTLNKGTSTEKRRLYNKPTGLMHQVEGPSGYVRGCVNDPDAVAKSHGINTVQVDNAGIVVNPLPQQMSTPQSIVGTSSSSSDTGWSELITRAEKKASQSLDVSMQVVAQFAELGKKQGTIESEFSALDAKWTAKLAGAAPVVIKHADGPSINVGRQHRQFTKLVKLVISTHGRGIVFLTGEPGSMKTSAVEPLAKALGELPFYVVSINNLTSRTELLGYMDGHGQYVPSPLYNVVKNGGVFLLDEVDAGNANGLTALNTAATNSFVGFPNGEVVRKHAQCYIIAAGNTIGAGANPMFVGRNQLDMATRTRFIYLDWQTDWELVEEIVSKELGQSTWAKEVHRLHDVVLGAKIQFVVSSRVALVGASMISDGFTKAEVLDSMLWPHLTPDERKRVENELSHDEQVSGAKVNDKTSGSGVKFTPPFSALEVVKIRRALKDWGLMSGVETIMEMRPGLTSNEAAGVAKWYDEA